MLMPEADILPHSHIRGLNDVALIDSLTQDRSTLAKNTSYYLPREASLLSK